jgi:hypothetical protein
VDWQSGAQGCTKESQKRNKGRNMGGKREGADRVKEIMYGRRERQKERH